MSQGCVVFSGVDGGPVTFFFLFGEKALGWREYLAVVLRALVLYGRVGRDFTVGVLTCSKLGETRWHVFSLRRLGLKKPIHIEHAFSTQHRIYDLQHKTALYQNKSLVADEKIHGLLRFTISTNVKKDVEQPYTSIN